MSREKVETVFCDCVGEQGEQCKERWLAENYTWGGPCKLCNKDYCRAHDADTKCYLKTPMLEDDIEDWDEIRIKGLCLECAQRLDMMMKKHSKWTHEQIRQAIRDLIPAWIEKLKERSVPYGT